MKQLLLLSSVFICAISCCSSTTSNKQECLKENTANTTQHENKPVGGYSKATELTVEELEVFTSAIKNYDTHGKNYIVKSVSKQIVAGTNYKFICDIDNSNDMAEILIFQPLPHTGQKAKVISINKLP